MRRPSERTLLFLVGAVQFVNILDFMMVMPLGPDFARALGIPTSALGVVGGAYTAAAGLAGLAGSRFLDRFDRRKALAVTMLGLVVGTAAGGMARGLASMVAARVVAGAFGGPATSLAISIVADAVPAERRGKALGAVMGAFSVASVLGVPAGLKLAELGGWQVPFLAVAGMGLLIAGAALFLMPPMTAHLAPGRARAGSGMRTLLRTRPARLSLTATATTMAAGFAIIPNISAHLQFDLGYPRARLELLYMVGGALSFAVLRLAGRWVDRFGAARVSAAGTVLYLAVLGLGFAYPPPWLPVMGLFAAFMTANSLRNVSTTALASRVPGPSERAGFLSTQSAVQHFAAAAGAALSTQVLTARADGSLVGLPVLAAFSASLAVLLPFLHAGVATGLARRLAPGEGDPAPAPVAEPTA